MGAAKLKKRAPLLLLTTVLAVVAGSLYLLSLSTERSAAFTHFHLWLILVNAAAALVLIVVIVANLVRLGLQYRRREPGTRLTGRLVAVFIALAVLPVGTVYYFSVQFISQGIDSWFDVRISRALDDALQLSRHALDQHMGSLLSRSMQAADFVSGIPNNALPGALADARDNVDASELSVFGPSGRIIATSSSLSSGLLPLSPSLPLVGRLNTGKPYVGLVTLGNEGLFVRVLLPLSGPLPTVSPRVLQALYPVAGQANSLAQHVEAAYTRYRELVYLRRPLKYSFVLTLSLVMLLSLLAAVWAAFFAARRLVAPMQDLVRGTRAVARGDFATRLKVPTHDDIGFLVLSFNEMTSRLAEAREAASRGQAELESERAWLRGVLSGLSSGVITLDQHLFIRSINTAAAMMLGLSPRQWSGQPVGSVVAANKALAELFALANQLPEGRRELEVVLPSGKRVLSAGCTRLLRDTGEREGYVLIFDDVTDLIQAQRDAAWGEVARRLAHEIKNPLTPIQLAAERLRRRYSNALTGRDAEILDRATRTVIEQVKAMKEMVNAFSEYARSPALLLQPVDPAKIIQEVCDLYRGREDLVLDVELEPNLPPVQADAARMRQILHNLLKNAIEAQEGAPDGARIKVRAFPDGEDLVLEVSDAGPGFEPEILARAFEPYVTIKRKGTGLGLAVVRKLAEEHGGGVHIENQQAGGARVIVRLRIQPVTGVTDVREYGGGDQ